MNEMLEPTGKVVNNRLIDMFENGNEKQAQDAVTDYVRIRVREDGFLRQILPPVQIQNGDFDRTVDTDKPSKVIDVEPSSPAAYSMPFGTSPIGEYIRGRRFRIMFDRIATRRFSKDMAELRTWDMDIRQVISDNAIKDMLAEEDGKFIGMVNTVLGGAAGSIVPATGTAQWVQISGGISRDTLAEAMKVMPRNNTNHLNAGTVLVNNVTIWDIVKFGRDEVGADKAQEMFFNGFAEQQMLGKRWLVTIKRDLVPDDTIYLFAEPKFLGKFFTIEDVTMYAKREAYMLQFFAYECIGAGVANVAGLGRVDFTTC